MEMLFHSISSFCECINNQIFIRYPPSPHCRIRVRIDNRSDIVSNIRILPSLVVKGNLTKRERREDGLNVDFWTTCDADMKTRKPKADEVLYEVKDLFAGGWDPKSARTFIERIQDDISRAVIRKREHLR